MVRAISKTWETSVFTLQMLGKMVVGEVSWKNVSGPITIADYAGKSAQMGVAPYLGFLALISISLGVLNLLPIPVLDGGHLMYYVIEIIKGSPLSAKAIEIGQQVGMVLLFALMAFAIYNDVAGLSPVKYESSSYLVALVFVVCASASWAREPFIVKDIRVEGIQRTEAGTVFSYLPVKVGDTLDDEKAAAAIKALYATGFFKDVRLESEDGVLVVVVEERPAIAQISIIGAKEFEKDKLKEGLKQAGLAESRIFDRSMLERAEQELKQQYISRGKYAVKITTTTTPMERNRVAINFHVDEGKTAKIRKINIVGNKAFKEKDLLTAFVLRTPGLLTWFTKEDQYSKQKLGARSGVVAIVLSQSWLSGIQHRIHPGIHHARHAGYLHHRKYIRRRAIYRIGDQASR